MSTAIPKQGRNLYEFGSFQLDPAERKLARAGERISLAPKAFDTLVALVEQRGHVLSKDELIKSVWPDSFVEENNLTQNISALRKALGEVPGAQQYIETVPRLGYRFVAPVREVPAGGQELTSVERLGSLALSPEGHQAQGIEEISGEKPQIAKGARQRITPSPWFRHTLIGFVSAILGLAFGLYAYFSTSSRTASGGSTMPVRASVAILGFRNLSESHDDDWLSTAFAEMLTTEMAAGERLRTVSGEDIARMKRDMKLSETEGLSKTTLAKVRTSLGADFTVSGSYMKIGEGSQSRIRLDLQLQDTSKGEIIGSVSEVGSSGELFELVSHSGEQLRAKLGTPVPSNVQQNELRATLPRTVQAAQSYSEGLEKLRAFDAPAAEVLLSKTVSADPKFALGHAALALAWSALGYDERAKAEAKSAVDLSQNMSREDRLLITGRFQEITHAWDQAVETYKLLTSFFPDNLDYGLRLVSAQTSDGKGRDALTTIENLRRLRPPLSEDPQIDLAEATAAESLGDFKRESQAADAAAHKGEILGERLLVARARFRQGWAFSRLGEPQQALQVLEQARTEFAAAGDREGAASTLRVVANVLFNQGNYSKAKPTGQQALEIFTQIGDRRGMAQSLNMLAIIDLDQGELEKAKALFEQSLQIEREVDSRINVAGALGNIANVLEAEGALAEAQRLTDESIKVFVEVGDQRALATALSNRANLLLQQGDLPGATKSYDDALQTAKNIGYQRGEGFDLSGISEVLADQGNLQDARKREEEALAIRKQIGEKHNAAMSQLHLALLSLDDHHLAEADALASQAIEQFRTDKVPDDEAFGQAILGRSYFAEGKFKEAQTALARATTLSRTSVNRPLRFEVAITSGHSKLDRKQRPSSRELAETTRALDSVRQEAQILGYLGYEFRARLALGQIEIKYGDFGRGRNQLAALEHDARARGFELLASQARTILEMRAVPNH